jgi:hypothetical protein
MEQQWVINSYENVLRNFGIIPVSDSHIYNIVVKVFKKTMRLHRSVPLRSRIQ